MHRALPSAMVAGLALATVSGCVCEPGFTKPREIEFDPQAELRAIAVSFLQLDPYYLVDTAGRVTILERVGRHYELAVVDTVEVSSRPLVDVVVAGDWVGVVDEAGTVHASVDAGQTWTSHPLDTELEPRGLVLDGEFIIIYGDDFVRALDGDEWFELPVPDGGWGSLRTALGDPLLVSDGESLLLDVGNSQPYSWQRIDAPTEVLTLADASGQLLLGGREGLVLETFAGDLGPESTWDEYQLGTDADVVAIEGRAALTNAGELFDLYTLAMLDVGDANVGMAHGSLDYVIFGANGPLITTDYEGCEYAR